MATLDQLPADQRAILELVVQRGRSYESLSEVLQIPPARVRELARNALSHLAPLSAERVDPDWRGQVADYVLGQQTGPESTATRGHLKRSEAARAWTLSLMDSLDSLYEGNDRPVIPNGDGGRARERDRREAEAAEAERERERREREQWEREQAERERERQEREQWERERAERERERSEREQRDREWERERARRARERAAAEPDGEGAVGVLAGEREPAPAAEPERERPAGPLSPEAREALRRRRLLGALAAAVAILGVAAIILFPITHTFSSSGRSHRRGPATTASNRIQIVGELPLRPTGSDRTATGLAVIARRGNQEQLVVQAKVPASKSGYAYEVWLYNSQNDVASLGAQVTDQQGNYQGAGPLPANFTRFKNIVISYEKIGTGTTLNGPIVLRGAFSDLQAPPQNQGGSTPGQTAPGTTPGQSPTPGQSTTPGQSPLPGQGTTP